MPLGHASIWRYRTVTQRKREVRSQNEAHYRKPITASVSDAHIQHTADNMARLKMARSCLTVIALSAVIEKIGVRATGVFELDLLSFTNGDGLLESGACCRGGPTASGQCSGSCSTYFRICFKHFMRELTDASDCTYGQYTTGVVGNNTFDFPRERGNFSNPIAFPFLFEWRGDFSLIVEAYDQTAEAGPDRLIYRMARADSARPSNDWLFSQAAAAGGGMTLSYRVKVVCDENYYGSGCNDQCVPRDEFDGHWNCSDSGERQCLPGWSGVYCDKPICLEGCDSTNGYCERPNECSCKTGYEGKLCNQCVPYPGCDKGFCRIPFECTCQDGWGGIFCNQDLNYCTHHRPCQNGGTCSNTGHGSYTCTCPASFSGTNCEVALDPGPGDSFYCQNGGTYFMTASGEPSCDCPQKFTGQNCELAVTGCEQSPCKNGATCEPAGQSYRCRCAPGWTGSKCQQNRDDCSPNQCQNGGKCVDKIGGFECVCSPGYNGSLCETTRDSCITSPCLNGGLCKSDGAGGFSCDCAAGYVGTRCQDDIDECALLMPCANGGQCRDLVNDFRCECPMGYGGRLCDEPVNDCLSAPCANGGKCSDLFRDYVCACPQPWEGKNCDQRQKQQPQLSTAADSEPPATTLAGVLPKQLLPPAEQVSTAAQAAHFTKEEIVLIVALGSGIPLLLLLTLACLLVCRRQRGLHKLQRQQAAGGSSGRAEAGGTCGGVEAGRKVAYFLDDCALEKNQNVVNSMNNRQPIATEQKQAVEGKCMSAKLSNELDDTSAPAAAAVGVSASDGCSGQSKASYYSVSRLSKVTNKDLLKSFSVDQRNVDYLTLYLADEQLPSSDLFNAELPSCSARTEPVPEPVRANGSDVQPLTVLDKQCSNRELGSDHATPLRSATHAGAAAAV